MRHHLTRDDLVRHFDQTKHVRFRDSYGGRVICLECQEIDAAAAEEPMATATTAATAPSDEAAPAP